ncbi:MAG: pyridoxal phosphate-dependent aminotransferase [bacterium]|nr:pyridoxal phosphate-dependent aminotransferase [bacterium]
MEERDLILDCALQNMPESFKKIVSKDDFIVTMSTRAQEIKSKTKDFVRSDIGQCVGVIPELEVYYGPDIGKIELRSLVAEFWTHFYKLDKLNYENVAITSGATQAFSLLFAILGYKQKVILSTPNWPTFPDTIAKAGAECIKFELINEDSRIRLEELSKFIEKEQAKIILINSPNNPSGIALTEEEMGNFAALARRHNLIIISDEVYNRIRFRDKPQTMLSFAPERTVVVSAASKEYLIPGHRIGFVISRCKELTNVFLKKLLRCDSSCTSVAGQDVIIPIIRKEVVELKNGKQPSFLVPVIKELRRRRDALGECLKSAGFGLMGDRLPDGSIFMLAKLPKEIKLSDVEFIEKAIEMKKFSGIPGSACGKPGWLRFSFGGMTMEDIEKFGKNLREVISTLK